MVDEVNINDSVWVRLSERGELILRRQHDKMRAQAPSIGRYAPPKRYPGGYSKFQIWQLMRTFGPHISLGSTPPFDTVIKFTEPTQITHNTLEGTDT